MNTDNSNTISNESLLLKKFNNRDEDAFVAIYNRFYKEFLLYAATLYQNINVSAEDAVQDVFAYVWQTKKITFESILKIKAFVIVAIKNRYKNHLDHLRCHTNYLDAEKQSAECENNFELDIFEIELYAILQKSLDILPKECGEVLKLYLNGYKSEEIAQILGKKIRTVYNQKNDAIALLRKKISKEELLFILLLIG